MESGYCGYINQEQFPESLARHEFCRCLTTEFLAFCKSLCDEDQNCKGYSFRSTEERNDIDDICFIYTTSSCPSNCFKNNVGSVGDLVDRAPSITDPFYNFVSLESGCFIKVDYDGNF